MYLPYAYPHNLYLNYYYLPTTQHTNPQPSQAIPPPSLNPTFTHPIQPFLFDPNVENEYLRMNPFYLCHHHSTHLLRGDTIQPFMNNLEHYTHGYPNQQLESFNNFYNFYQQALPCPLNHHPNTLSIHPQTPISTTYIHEISPPGQFANLKPFVTPTSHSELEANYHEEQNKPIQPTTSPSNSSNNLPQDSLNPLPPSFLSSANISSESQCTENYSQVINSTPDKHYDKVEANFNTTPQNLNTNHILSFTSLPNPKINSQLNGPDSFYNLYNTLPINDKNITFRKQHFNTLEPLELNKSQPNQPDTIQIVSSTQLQYDSFLTGPNLETETNESIKLECHVFPSTDDLSNMDTNNFSTKPTGSNFNYPLVNLHESKSSIFSTTKFCSDPSNSIPTDSNEKLSDVKCNLQLTEDEKIFQDDDNQHNFDFIFYTNKEYTETRNNAQKEKQPPPVPIVIESESPQSNSNCNEDLIIPSFGTSFHSKGTCNPCRFEWSRGCHFGADCRFCHHGSHTPEGSCRAIPSLISLNKSKKNKETILKNSSFLLKKWRASSIK